MAGRWMPVGQRFDGRYRKWSAGASINWNLENAELDRYASLCEIVTPKETGFGANRHRFDTRPEVERRRKM